MKLINIINEYWYLFIIGIFLFIFVLRLIFFNLQKVLKNDNLPRIFELLFPTKYMLDRLLKKGSNDKVLLRIEIYLLMWILNSYLQKIRGLIYCKLGAEHTNVMSSSKLQIDDFFNRVQSELTGVKCIRPILLDYYDKNIKNRLLDIRGAIYFVIMKNGTEDNMKEGIKNEVLLFLGSIEKELTERFLGGLK